MAVEKYGGFEEVCSVPFDSGIDSPDREIGGLFITARNPAR
jgi:hypothetical protein